MLTEGSMVEYLPVGSQEDPQTIIDKKNFEPWNPKSQSQPSVQSNQGFPLVDWSLSKQVHLAKAEGVKNTLSI